MEENTDSDSVIYVYRDRFYIPVEKYPEPLNHKKAGKFIPGHLTPRITAQAGLFTIHPDPYTPFDSEEIQRTVIPNSCRKDLKATLHRHGVDWASLFPFLDGLARHILWLRSKGF